MYAVVNKSSPSFAANKNRVRSLPHITSPGSDLNARNSTNHDRNGSKRVTARMTSPAGAAEGVAVAAVGEQQADQGEPGGGGDGSSGHPASAAPGSLPLQLPRTVTTMTMPVPARPPRQPEPPTGQHVELARHMAHLWSSAKAAVDHQTPASGAADCSSSGEEPDIQPAQYLQVHSVVSPDFQCIDLDEWSIQRLLESS